MYIIDLRWLDAPAHETCQCTLIDVL